MSLNLWRQAYLQDCCITLERRSLSIKYDGTSDIGIKGRCKLGCSILGCPFLNMTTAFQQKMTHAMTVCRAAFVSDNATSLSVEKEAGGLKPQIDSAPFSAPSKSRGLPDLSHQAGFDPLKQHRYLTFR